MKLSKSRPIFPPVIFNVFKPAGITSYDVVRHFKRHLPLGYGKIGHFGTLDPFASGVLMVGIAGAARLNDFIHDFLPKTYLAVGKLGVETPTGDHTSEITQKDETPYFRQEISRFSAAFIEEKLKEKFCGPYLQSPHKFSAAKFMGRNMHEWAREGIEVKKSEVERHIYDLQVVKYHFPYLSIRVTVSSGTYIRSLFTEMGHYLGTLGSLVSLVRESVGDIHFKDSLHKRDWPLDRSLFIMDKALPVQRVLPFSEIILDDNASNLFRNGGFLKPSQIISTKQSDFSNNLFWVFNEKMELLGLAEKMLEDKLRPKINFSRNEESPPSTAGGL